MTLGLSGKIVLVTGGASGIGETVVEGSAAESARPVVLDRDAKLRENAIRLDRTDDACGLR